MAIIGTLQDLAKNSFVESPTRPGYPALEVVSTINLVNDPSFSYYLIDDSESIEIPLGQEMLIARDLMVNGTLLVSGDIFQIPVSSSGALVWA